MMIDKKKHIKNLAGAPGVSMLLASLFLVTACSKSVVRTVIPPEKETETIDLNKIEMVSRSKDEKVLLVKQDSKGKYYIKFYLKYQGSGINVINSIRSGKIIFHQIVIKDARGEELGSDSINFHSFDVTLKDTRSMVQDDSGRQEITLAKQQKEPELENIEYSDSDAVPQIVGVKRMPDLIYPVAVYIEIWYIQPFFSDICYKGQGDVLSSSRIDKIFNKIDEENKKKLHEIRTKYEVELKNEMKKKRLTAKNLPVIEKFPSYKKGNPKLDQYQNEMKEVINSLNTSHVNPAKEVKVEGSPYHNVADFGNKLNFRIWKLISIPKYYKLAKDKTVMDKPEKDKKGEADSPGDDKSKKNKKSEDKIPSENE